MQAPPGSPPSLLDLLARQWRLRGAVAALRFNAEGSAVAFAAGGTLALAPLADAEPAERRLHTSLESGRTTIRPRRKAVPPPVTVEVPGGRAAPLAAFRGTSFAVADDAGGLAGVTPRGQVVPLDLRLGRPVTALDHHAATLRTACAAGGEVAIFPDDEAAAATRLRHAAEVAAVAFSPDGAELACAHAGGLAIWRRGERRDVAIAGRPTSVSWSPDAAWIACGLAEAGMALVRRADESCSLVMDYPQPVGSLAWSRRAGALATSGAFRPIAWSMATPPLFGDRSGALATGRAGLVPVEAVAAHPERDLLAVGYANGMLSIDQIGRPDELLLRPEGGGAVTALAWSGDGRHLAFGSAEGAAALVELPAALFK